MEEKPKSEALLGYERAERELFQRLVDGQITMADYQLGALDALQEFMHDFSADEMIATQKLALARHTDAANALAEGGHPQPGNDPNRPN